MRFANSGVGDRGPVETRPATAPVASPTTDAPFTRIRAHVVLASVLALGGCASDPAAEPAPRTCTTVDLACTPAYEPTYANVFAKTLQPTCGKSGASCHSSSGRQGGLAFEDANVAYDDLMAGKVTPGDAACSTVVYRVAATDGKIRMPPGRQLEAGEQCAIAQWIQNGAKK